MTPVSVRVAAVIIAFHPDLARLQALVDALTAGRVTTLWLIDNTPGESPLAIAPSPRLNIVRFGENRGIAQAQNHGIGAALASAHSHVILFDQDSAPPPDMIDRLLEVEAELLVQGHAVAASGPVFVDRKSGTWSTATEYGWSIVHRPVDAAALALPTDSLIASGALYRAQALRQVGGMIDALFIDWVDVEWTLRAKALGLRCYTTARTTMSHSIGDEATRLAGKTFNVHGDFRKFYIVRNALLLGRLGYIPLGARVAVIAKVLLKYIPAYLWLGPRRLAMAARLFGALRAGYSVSRADLEPVRFPLGETR